MTEAKVKYLRKTDREREAEEELERADGARKNKEGERERDGGQETEHVGESYRDNQGTAGRRNRKGQRQTSKGLTPSCLNSAQKPGNRKCL